MNAIDTTVNGIDLEALKKTMEAVANHPAQGIAKFQVSTKWAGGTRSRTAVEGWSLGGRSIPKSFTIHTDEPKELLGENSAPNPQEVLMAGLNACMMVGYVAGCAAKGIRLDSVAIETEGELDLRGFLGLDPSVKPGYGEIRYVVRVKGDGTREQFEAVHQTVMATSPNYFNLSQPIRLKPRLVVEPSQS
jgi:uncharacterized OsmC-like protein